MAQFEDVVYIKAEQSVAVYNKQVKLKDIATIWCSNPDILHEVENIEVMKFAKDNPGQKVISVIKLVEDIKLKDKSILISNLGEPDVIVYYKVPKKKNIFKERMYITFVCLVAFLGAGYSIMSYNTDVNAIELFSMLHELFIGEAPKGSSIVELAYAIGLAIGIIVFFNHGANKKISDDPTPLQVQMRLYEQDVNTAIIKDADRHNETIDVE